jgi:glycosyltransferase involved in cell wall biosynthesis
VEIVFDGIIFQKQARGGVSRIYDEVLPRMAALGNNLKITILTTNNLKQTIPKHPRIKHQKLFPVEMFLRPKSVWGTVINQLRGSLQRRAVQDINTEDSIWHSTYYTRLNQWRGKEVVIVYDMLHERYKELFNQKEYQLLRSKKAETVASADAVICISDTTKMDLGRYYDIDMKKVFTVHLAHGQVFKKQDQDKENVSLPTKKPFLLYVGKRRFYKNFDFFLEGFHGWSTQKDVDLVVVGQPWERGEEQLLTEFELQDRVILLSSVSDKHLSQLYNHAAAFVFPSLYEGFGIPLLEAMACGCPIVASSIPSTIEVAGDIPYYFIPDNLGSLLSALDEAFYGGRDSKRVKRGMDFVNTYSWDKTARNILGVYHSILGGE